MIEKQPHYGLSSELPTTLNQFKTNTSVLATVDEMYQPPTPDHVRQLIKLMGLVGSQVGALTGVDSRTVRRWIAPPDQPGSRQIPYSAWRLLLGYAGVIEINTVEAEKLLKESKSLKDS